MTNTMAKNGVEESETRSVESQQTISMSTDQHDGTAAENGRGGTDEATFVGDSAPSAKRKSHKVRRRKSHGLASAAALDDRTVTSLRATTSSRVDQESDDETHQELFNRVQKAQEIYRSIPPRDMVRVRGEKIIVIQPGSQVLRLGIAGTPDFVEVPNCVAYRRRKSKEKVPSKKKRRGRGKRGPVESTDHKMNDTDTEGEEVSTELELNVDVDETAATAGCRDIETLLGFTRDAASGEMSKPTGCSALTFPVAEGESEQESEQDLDWDSEETILFGDRALAGARSGEFDLHFCIHNGHLHQHGTAENRSKQRLFDIWWWAISTKLGVERKDLASYSCVLVVSQVTYKREVRDMVDVVLRDLGMDEVAIHTDSVASLFTHGCQVACVANVDTHFTSVVCIEDGTCIPGSTIILPYGRWDVLNLMRSLLEGHGCWPFGKGKGKGDNARKKKRTKNAKEEAVCDSINAFKALGDIFSKCCKFVADGEGNSSPSFDPENTESGNHHPMLTLSVRGSASEGTAGKCVLRAGYEPLLAPMALYVPSAFGLTRAERERRRLQHVTTSYEDDLDSFMIDSVISNPGHAMKKTVTKQHSEHRSVPWIEEERVLPVDKAIVKSILDSTKNRPELRNRLFQNLVLVGDFTCEVPGCADMLERRVSKLAPQQEDSAVEAVKVLRPKVEGRETIYRGGALLGLLDFVQENWIQRKEWLSGGVNTGADAKKLTRMNKFTLQMLWNGAY